MSRGLALFASLQHEASAVPSVSRVAFNETEAVGQRQASLYWSYLNYLVTEDVKVNDRYLTCYYVEQEHQKEVVSS